MGKVHQLAVGSERLRAPLPARTCISRQEAVLPPQLPTPLSAPGTRRARAAARRAQAGAPGAGGGAQATILSSPRTRQARAAVRRAQAGAPGAGGGAQAALRLQREHAPHRRQLPQHLGFPTQCNGMSTVTATHPQPYTMPSSPLALCRRLTVPHACDALASLTAPQPTPERPCCAQHPQRCSMRTSLKRGRRGASADQQRCSRSV